MQAVKKILDLNLLKDGVSTGLSIFNGGFLAEAASVVLDSHGHKIIVEFIVEGDINESYELTRLELNEYALNSFRDLEEATQFGAMGIAVAIINDTTGYKAVRSWKGTGFDYWFGNLSDSFPFQEKLRVEVSGDRTGTLAEVRNRLKNKLEQTKVSDELNLPAYAVIVEFSQPMSLIGFRNE